VAAWVDAQHLAWADAFDSPAVFAAEPPPPGLPAGVDSGSDHDKRVRVAVGVGVGVGVAVLLLAGSGLAMWGLKKRKQRQEQQALDKYYQDSP
jgi:hypothetical protein